MIFGGSMSLYLLVEKRLKGQRLGNVGLNVDENIRNREEKANASHGPKGLGRPRAVHELHFFP